MVTRSSAAAATSSGSPPPSPPTNSTAGTVQSMAAGLLPPRGTAAIVRTPCSPARRSTSPACSPKPTGTRNALPMLPRSAFHPNGFAEAPHTQTAVASSASAARTMAPTLPGSCTCTGATISARASSSTSGANGLSRAIIATIPDGVFTGLIAAITGSETT